MRDRRGEFSHIAERISGLLNERSQENSGISIEDIHILSGKAGMINCYLGFPTNECCPVAFFISINGVAAQGRGHLNFKKMMVEFHRHMYMRCFMKTRHAVIISNDWVTKEYEKYHEDIEHLRRRGKTVEAYFVSRGGSLVLIDI